MKNIFKFLFVVFYLLLATTNPLPAQWIKSNTLGFGSFAVSGTKLFAGNSSGVFLSTDGSTWTKVNTGLTNLTIYELAVSSTNLFAGTNGGVFLSNINDTNWIAVDNGLGNKSVRALVVSGANLFAGTFGFGVFLSTNNGTSWSAVNTGLTNSDVRTLAISGTNIFAGTQGGVFLSTNNGGSWTAVNTGLTRTSVNSFFVFGSNLFTGTWNGSSTSLGMFLSTNNGTSWSEFTIGGHSNDNARSFAVSEKNLFVGTSWGVFISADSGKSWTSKNTGLPVNDVGSLAVFGTFLYATPANGGLYRRPLSEMITKVDKISTKLPINHILAQNFPNPFNPSTTISFSIPSKSFVSLKVFDVLGKEISTLLSEELSAGTYSKLWNGDGLVSGVYFYRLQSGSFLETKKLLLLR